MRIEVREEVLWARYGVSTYQEFRGLLTFGLGSARIQQTLRAHPHSGESHQSTLSSFTPLPKCPVTNGRLAATISSPYDTRRTK
jgi:hypothetical protein